MLLVTGGLSLHLPSTKQLMGATVASPSHKNGRQTLSTPAKRPLGQAGVCYLCMMDIQMEAKPSS